MKDSLGRFVKEPGNVIRDYITEKMGNPVMGSKKQAAVNEAVGETEGTRVENAKKYQHEYQENYDSRIHKN